MNAPRTIDGYVRVSQVRGREGDSFISPTVQREQIETWAKLHGVTVAAIHEDLDVSGARESRPGLDEALRRVEAGETGGIVVAKLDRLARSLIVALDVSKRIDAAGGALVSIAEGIDPTTPAGKMMMRLLLILAEFELDRIRDQWRISREKAVARGVHIASRVPTGYQRGEDGRLVPHPDDAPVVRRVFERRAQGASWRELANLLDQAGVVGPYHAAQWTTRAVSHVIENTVYLGQARHGEFVNREAHEPLVTREVWEAAQRAPLGPTQRSDDAPALLAGLLRCAGCRHLLKPDKQTLRDGTRVRTYRCRRRHASGTCQAAAFVLASVIEPYVEAAFLRHADTLTADPVAATEAVDTAIEAVEAAEAELVAYRDSTAILSVLGEKAFLDGLKARADALDQAQADLAELRAHAQPAGLPASADLHALWPSLTTEHKQRALRATIDTVVVRANGRANAPIGSRSLLLWRGEAPESLPGRGRRVPFEPFPWPHNPTDIRVKLGEDADERALESLAG